MNKNHKSLKQEVGSHRFQRIPPTERKGRTHTSSVKVALIDAEIKETKLLEKDLKVSWFSGTGKGGQRRNKCQTSCRMVHVPSGISETRTSGRSRDQNYEDCKRSIEERLNQLDLQDLSVRKGEQYKAAGSGQRGDKIRTIRFQDNQAWDDRTGKVISAKAYMNGGMKEFWRD